MAEYIAFLRGINLGKRRLKMDLLRELFEGMKFKRVQTFIASGNVVFESGIVDTTRLESLIEVQLQAALGYSVETFVRSRHEIADLAAAHYFPAADLEDPENTIHLGFLKEPLNLTVAKAFAAVRTDVDTIAVKGREYFWLCRIRSSDSKLWTLPAVRALKLPSATLRNRTTIQKMASLFPARNSATAGKIGRHRQISIKPDKS
jgi:uncharacterized protein (DUF1697 family)